MHAGHAVEKMLAYETMRGDAEEAKAAMRELEISLEKAQAGMQSEVKALRDENMLLKKELEQERTAIAQEKSKLEAAAKKRLQEDQEALHNARKELEAALSAKWEQKYQLLTKKTAGAEAKLKAQKKDLQARLSLKEAELEDVQGKLEAQLKDEINKAEVRLTAREKELESKLAGRVQDLEKKHASEVRKLKADRARLEGEVKEHQNRLEEETRKHQEHRETLESEHKKGLEKATASHEKASIMAKAVMKIATKQKIEHIIEHVMQEIDQLLGAESAMLFVVEQSSGVMWSISDHREDRRIEVPISGHMSGIAGYVAKTGDLLNIRDVSEDKRVDVSVDAGLRLVKKHGTSIRSLLLTPVVVQGEVVAVVQVVNKKHHPGDGDIGEATSYFSAEDCKLLMSLCSSIGTAIVNCRSSNASIEQLEEAKGMLEDIETELEIAYANAAAEEHKSLKKEYLLDVARDLALNVSSQGLALVFETVSWKVRELLDAERAQLYVIDEDAQELWYGGEGRAMRLPMSSQGSGEYVANCALTGNTINLYGDEIRFAQGEGKGMTARSPRASSNVSLSFVQG